MTTTERLMISKEKKVCVNCKYFIQHYIYDKRFNNDFSPCNDGHCVKPRLKNRKPKNKACEHFEWNQEMT
ncbi:MAG: hypothetical protein HFE57_05600 [Firmicutes bacterium]|jgi:hypothetical protein|nr:hypothetical protein [Bacillota bacterium]